MRFCFLFAITVGLFFGQTAYSEQSAPIVFDCFPAEDCESCDGCATGLCGSPSRLIYHPSPPSVLKTNNTTFCVKSNTSL